MKENCLFCKIAHGLIPSEKVYEDDHTYAFLDINPKSEHHALVIPKKHYENMFDVTDKEAAHVMQAIKNIVDMYGKEYGITDLNVLNNSGKAAGQEVFHLHFHIIPNLN